MPALKVKRGTSPEDVYESYEKWMMKVKEEGREDCFLELHPLEPWRRDVIIAELHPTKRSDSRDMTRKIIQLLYDKRVITAQMLYDNFGWSDKPVMKRLKVLMKHRLVVRVAKKYYIATPRLVEFVDKGHVKHL